MILYTVVGVTTPHVLQEVLTFVANIFQALLASTTKELDSFNKDTHSSNSTT